jgi:hypothetical protein
MNIPTSSEVKEQFRTTSHRGQAAVRRAGKAVSEKAAELPRPAAVIASTREFAGKVIDSERKLAGKVLHAAKAPKE